MISRGKQNYSERNLPQKPYCYTMWRTCTNINTKFILRWKPLSDFRVTDVAGIVAVSVSVKSICFIIQPAVRRINDSHCLELRCFLKRICNTQDIYTLLKIYRSDNEMISILFSMISILFPKLHSSCIPSSGSVTWNLTFIWLLFWSTSFNFHWKECNSITLNTSHFRQLQILIFVFVLHK
jgi:hypothetical protein